MIYCSIRNPNKDSIRLVYPWAVDNCWTSNVCGGVGYWKANWAMLRKAGKPFVYIVRSAVLWKRGKSKTRLPLHGLFG